MSASDDPGLADDPGLQEYLATMRATTAQLRADREAMEQDLAELRAQARQEERERADLARSGDLGPDWQRVQRRIDAGESTVQEVLTGRDRSAEAARIRDAAADRTAEAIIDLRRRDEAENGQRFDELGRTLRSLAAAIERAEPRSDG